MRFLIRISANLTGFALVLAAGGAIVAPMAHRDLSVMGNFAIATAFLFLISSKLESLLAEDPPTND